METGTDILQLWKNSIEIEYIQKSEPGQRSRYSNAMGWTAEESEFKPG
jgi:hypothetical protein